MRIIFQLPGLTTNQYIVRLLFVHLLLKPLGGALTHPYFEMKNLKLSLKAILGNFWSLMSALFLILEYFGRQ